MTLVSSLMNVIAVPHLPRVVRGLAWHACISDPHRPRKADVLGKNTQLVKIWTNKVLDIVSSKLFKHLTAHSKIALAYRKYHRHAHPRARWSSPIAEHDQRRAP
jgi:hypothetical protein